MTRQEIFKYLESFVDYEKIGYSDRKIFKLERTRILAESMDNPQKDFFSIHIAGTKGKGSIANFISSILNEAGFRVGLYTSPHLKNIRERIKINNKSIPESDFLLEVTKIKKVLDSKKIKFKPTFFEILTILAFNYFKKQKVDFGVIETGLGGRLDATNIVKSKVSVMSPISYDHTHILGKKLKSIAQEKSDIIKKNTICVSAPQTKTALQVIKRKCKALNTKLILIGKDINSEEISHSDRKEIFNVIGARAAYKTCSSRLLGLHQIDNASCAVGAVEMLNVRDRKINPDVVRRGIAKAKNYGRCEVICRKPYIVLDGAQNKASARSLKKTIERNFKYERPILVLGISKNKDTKGICGELAPIADRIILTKSKNKRALDPEGIKKFIKNKNIILTNSVKEAMAKASERADPNDLIVVTGSLFVIGEINAKTKLYP
ncbi:MAG: folylpolyglutamate synthase/dihydrofolate synthase family protein [Candidatus Omnitrophota bacterium]